CCAPQIPRQFGAGERLVFARDLVDRTGYRLPPSCTSNTMAEGLTVQLIQNQSFGDFSLAMPVQKDTRFERPQHIFLRSEHGICMGDLPEDLTMVVAAWESLPAAVKAGIVAMVTVARQQ